MTIFLFGRRIRFSCSANLIAVALICCAGCGEATTETVGFNELDSQSAIADASEVEDQFPAHAPSDVTTPPSETDPFLAMENEQPVSPETDEQTSNDAGAADSSNGDTESTPVKQVTQSQPAPKKLSALELMFQQRAAAIAKANGTEVPDFDEEEDTTPREIELLVPENSFKTEGPDGAIRVSFDDLDLLKILNMAPVPTSAADHFPKWMKDLHGKKVRLRGFMYPKMVEAGIKKFRMARDNDICCFVKIPKIYDTARVDMKEGVTTNYIEGKPFDVVGTFRINPREEFGELFELWRIDDATIVKR